MKLSTMSERVMQILERENMTQTDLAKKLGVSKQAIQQWVKNDTPVSPRKIILLIELFPDINARWFITGEGNIDDKEPGQVAEPLPEYRNVYKEKLIEEKEIRISELKEMISEMKENKVMANDRIKKQSDEIEFLRGEIVRLGHGEILESRKAHSA